MGVINSTCLPPVCPTSLDCEQTCTHQESGPRALNNLQNNRAANRRMPPPLACTPFQCGSNLERERRLFRTARDARAEARVLKAEGKFELALDAYTQAMWLVEYNDVPPLQAREAFLESRETILTSSCLSSDCALGAPGGGPDGVAAMVPTSSGAGTASASGARTGGGADTQNPRSHGGEDDAIRARLESAEWLADRAAALDALPGGGPPRLPELEQSTSSAGGVLGPGAVRSSSNRTTSPNPHHDVLLSGLPLGFTGPAPPAPSSSSGARSPRAVEDSPNKNYYSPATQAALCDEFANFLFECNPYPSSAQTALQLYERACLIEPENANRFYKKGVALQMQQYGESILC